MGHTDPNSLQDDGGPDPAAPRGDDKAGTRPPGSLMSLKIRKRTPGAAPSPAEQAGPRPAPSETKTETETKKKRTPSPEPDTPPRAERAEAASDPISRVARRVQSARAARTAPPVARPPTTPPAPPPATPPAPASVQPKPAPAPSPAPSPGPALPTAEEPVTPGPEAGPPAAREKRDIVAYWAQLRGARRYPRSGDLDAATLGDHWPNSILMRCRPGSQALEPEKVFMTGESTASSLTGLRGGSRVNLSPMMLQWLLGLAGEVVREGRPMNDVETFPSVNRVVHYRAVALPFSDSEREVDHVLCHVGPEV